MIQSIIQFLRKPIVLAMIAIAGLIFLLAAYRYRTNILYIVSYYISGNSTRPNHEFGEQPIPPAPDYADLSYWMALPQTEDLADFDANGAIVDSSTADVDLFWVHPTSYPESTLWNQPAEEDTYIEHLALQASVFNLCCRIYAPRYRQANLHSFFEFSESSSSALDLAYQDVLAAFTHYLENENDGRPFILAGHSQGSFHLNRLIREEIVGTQLEEQFIVGYLVGHDFETDTEIPICTEADQTGCAVTWNAISAGADLGDHPTNFLCVNPLNWMADDTPADFSEHKGTLFLTTDGASPLESQVVDGVCLDGHLQISEIRSESYPLLSGEQYYHDYDYSIFYVDTQVNADLRIESFLTAQN